MPLTKPNKHPIPAWALIRAGEAADGMRDGQTYFLTVKLKQPTNAAEAVNSIRPTKSEPKDWDPEKEVCIEVLTPSDGGQSVEGVMVSIQGVSTELQDCADAAFWSLSALDKFFFPYYCSLYGPEIAAEMKRTYVAQSTQSPLVCHDPGSNPCKFVAEEGLNPTGVVTSSQLFQSALAVIPLS